LKSSIPATSRSSFWFSKKTQKYIPRSTRRSRSEDPNVSTCYPVFKERGALAPAVRGWRSAHRPVRRGANDRDGRTLVNGFLWPWPGESSLG